MCVRERERERERDGERERERERNKNNVVGCSNIYPDDSTFVR